MSDADNPYLPPLALAYFIARGRNWARIVYLLLTIFALVTFCFSMLNALNQPQGVTFVADLSLTWLATVFVPQALPVAVVLLLFVPGRAWFRPRG